jgi:hypothetical protein
VTLTCFALGGLIYGPFIPLTYTLLQSSATSASLPAVLAARSAIIMVSSPLGTAAGGPIVATLGAAWTLTASGAATVLLAVFTGIIWRRKSQPTHRDRDEPSHSLGGPLQPSRSAAGCQLRCPDNGCVKASVSPLRRGRQLMPGR